MRAIPRHLFDAASKPLARRFRRNPLRFGPTGISVEICKGVTSGAAVAFVVEKDDAKGYAIALRRVARIARLAEHTGFERGLINLVSELAEQFEGGAK